MIAAVQAFEPRRLVGGAAVLLLHLLVIAALLSTTRWTFAPTSEPKEIILHLIAPKSEPNPEEKKKLPTAAPRTVREPAPAFVPPPAFTPPTTSTAPALNGLNRQLFGCTPDALASATPAERAACASASLGPRYDPGATDFRDHTDRSRSAAQWARDRARKNSPLLLPCMSPDGWSPLYTAYCLAKTAVTGKLEGESQRGYQDQPDHIANEGDTRLAPVPH
ncbi:MAG TPA: hypothetical protein VIM56_03475 [Rhizomicrobium sp.]